jgi:mono/diheme cytochrome c family protein
LIALGQIHRNSRTAVLSSPRASKDLPGAFLIDAFIEKTMKLKSWVGLNVGLVIFGASALVGAMGHKEPKLPPVATAEPDKKAEPAAGDPAKAEPAAADAPKAEPAAGDTQKAEPATQATPPKAEPAPTGDVKAEPAPPADAAKPVKKVASSNPLSGDTEAIAVGTKLYFTWCVQCHGQKANGESRFGKYAGDLTKFWRGYKEFVLTVKNGRPGKQMPPWKELLDDENIAKIGAFLETRAEEGANWK